MSAVSGRDVWAAANRGPLSRYQAAVLHWNGRVWSVVRTWSNVELFDVLALSPRDVWAVGAVADKALALHWDGLRWRSFVQASPDNDDALAWSLTALAAASSDSVWSVGAAGSQQIMSGAYPLALHWNGARWRTMPPPSTPWMPQLVAVAASGSQTIWIAGFDAGYWRDAGDSSFLAQWAGTRWLMTQLPQGELVDALASTRSGAIWAVGVKGTGSGDNGFPARSTPLIKRYGC